MTTAVAVIAVIGIISWFSGDRIDIKDSTDIHITNCTADYKPIETLNKVRSKP